MSDLALLIQSINERLERIERHLKIDGLTPAQAAFDALLDTIDEESA
jgi:hypothetical protein